MSEAGARESTSSFSQSNRPDQQDLGSNQIQKEYVRKRQIAHLEGSFKLLKEGLYTDIEVIVENETFAAHRLVLATLSDYFNALFSIDNTMDGKVTLHNLKPEEFSILLHYAYTGVLKITMDNVEAVLVASDYLAIDHVKDICARFMDKEIDSTNCCDVITLSKNYHIPWLCERALNILGKDLDNISRRNEFYNLDANVLVEYFRNDSLLLCNGNIPLVGIEQEKVVLNSVLRYVDNNKGLNQTVIRSLLETVRLVIVPQQDIEESLKNVDRSSFVYQCMMGYLGIWERGRTSFRAHVVKQSFPGGGLNRDVVENVTECLPKELPKSWLSCRLYPKCTIAEGRVFGTIGQHRFVHASGDGLNDPELEISKVDIFLGLWDNRVVISGLKVSFRHHLLFEKECIFPPCFVKVKGECDIIDNFRDNMDNHTSFILEKGEFITNIVIGSGWMIDRLGFETNFGRKLDPFGGPGGSEHLEPRGIPDFAKACYLYDFQCKEVVTENGQFITHVSPLWKVFI